MASSHARERAERGSWIAALACALIGACGGSAPTESAVFYDPALRPGVATPTTVEERELLGRLSELSEARSVRIGDRTFMLELPYAAASGRRCRAIANDGRRRLACEGEDGWVFVPDVQGGETGAAP